MFPSGLAQPQGSFRFSVDALLLAEFFKKPLEESLFLDLGTGCGIVALAYLRKNPKALGVGIDFQPELILSAKENAQKLALEGRFLTQLSDLRNIFKNQEWTELYPQEGDYARGDKDGKGFFALEKDIKDDALATLNKRIKLGKNFLEMSSSGNKYSLKKGVFDLVLANPPYGIYGQGRLPQTELREKALFGPKNILADFFKCAKLALKPSGIFGLVFPASRLDSLILEAEKNQMGLRRLLIVYGREGKKAKLVILECQKDCKDALEILPPLVLYDFAHRLTKEAKAFCPELA